MKKGEILKTRLMIGGVRDPRNMMLDEELKKLDDEIGLVIVEIEELKHRMIRDWNKEKKRETIKKEIKEINGKIQKIFTRIIELTQD